MTKFEYEISIPANSKAEADKKMKAIAKIAPKLTAEEFEKIAEVLSNPIQLALIKTKLGL